MFSYYNFTNTFLYHDNKIYGVWTSLDLNYCNNLVLEKDFFLKVLSLIKFYNIIKNAIAWA